MGHYDQHSAMRNVSYLTAQRTKFGENRNAAPNWEVEAGRGTPWFDGGRLTFDDDRGVKPVGVVFEWLTDNFSALAWPESWLDRPSFEALLADSDDDSRISVLITEQLTAESAFAQLFEYQNLWCRIGAGGTFEIGRWKSGNIDISGLPIIGSDDLADEEPTLSDNEDLRDTINFVTVRFKDREHYFHDELSQPAFDAGNFRQTGVVRDVVLDRPWITDRAIANRYAAEYCAFFARPKYSGTIKVKYASMQALGLREGDLFKLDSASFGREFIMRLLEYDIPAARDGICSLTIENERGIWPSLYVQPPATGPGNFHITPAAITNKRVFELPSGLKTSNKIQIAILAQRPTAQIVGFRVHTSVDNTTYDLVAPQNNFAAFGKVVTAAYPSTTDDLDVTVGIQFELFGVDNISSQTDTQRDDNNLLLVVGNEVISVGAVTALGDGKYKAFVRRARFGTTKAEHAIDADCWFILRDRLTRVENRNFVPGTTRWFKLQTFTALQEFDLTLVTSFSYVFHTAPAVGSVYNLALTSNAYVDAQGQRQAVILAAWDYWLDQDITLFGVAYRRTSSIGLLYNAEQDLAFPLSAKGDVALEVATELGASGLAPATASLVRLFNLDQSAWFDVVCIGGPGEERMSLIPAVDSDPGAGFRLFVPGLNLWFDLLCIGDAGEERLTLSEGEPGLGTDPADVIAALEAAVDDAERAAVPSTPGAPWTYLAIDTPDIEIPVTAGVSYEVKVRPINSLGEPGEYCDPEEIIAGMIDLFQIANLEIAGQGADLVLHGIDCHLAWEAISPDQNSSVRGGPSGSPDGAYDPGIVDFEIKIYEGTVTLEEIDAGTAVRVWRDVSGTPEYNFSFERNAAAWFNLHGTPGAYPVFTVWVGGFDPANRSAAPQIITVTKEAPPVGSNILMDSAIGAMDLSWANPAVEGLDYAEINISGTISGNIRKVAFPGTTHHVVPLANGSSFKFLLRWFNKFGQASAYLESDWSPEVGGGTGGGVPDSPSLSPDGGAIDNTTTITAFHPGAAAMYWRRDTTTPTTADTLYTAPIEVDPPGSETEFDITIIAFQDGVFSAPITKHFLPYTLGGGTPPEQPDQPFVLPDLHPEEFFHGGIFNTGSQNFIDVFLASIQDGDWSIFYTIAEGGPGSLGGGWTAPSNPTHDGSGNPTGSTVKVTGDHLTLRVTDPDDDRFYIKALVWKPGATIEDSVILHARYGIIHT